MLVSLHLEFSFCKACTLTWKKKYFSETHDCNEWIKNKKKETSGQVLREGLLTRHSDDWLTISVLLLRRTRKIVEEEVPNIIFSDASLVLDDKVISIVVVVEGCSRTPFYCFAIGIGIKADVYVPLLTKWCLASARFWVDDIHTTRLLTLTAMSVCMYSPVSRIHFLLWVS